MKASTEGVEKEAAEKEAAEGEWVVSEVSADEEGCAAAGEARGEVWTGACRGASRNRSTSGPKCSL